MTTTLIDLDIRSLEEGDADWLRRIWLETKGTAPPKTFARRLMRLALAWDAQAARGDGETAKTQKAWQKIMKSRSGIGPRTEGSAAPQDEVVEGTRILKEWGGATHEVLITAEGGAIWNCQNYSSLSAVARAMTGTNRNGPKFFGLRNGAKP